MDRDFVRVGPSKIQGDGVFAKRQIPRGTRILEYAGERIARSKLLIEVAEGKTSPIYFFRLNDSTVIDGARNGNASRFINHSCEPNCEAHSFDECMFIYAMRDIIYGEELTFDYRLGSGTNITQNKENAVRYQCRCGALNCRGTMLAKKTILKSF